MPTFHFEAMDATGQEIKDTIDAATQDEAQATIRQMGYFVTKITAQKGEKATTARKSKTKSFVIGGASGKTVTLFTRQLSILQDAGLPILRSLRILENQAPPSALKNGLIDVCDEIEGGATLSEAMAKAPKVFDRLYINMIKAGEAGGALELILQRLADFKERSQALKSKVQGAMIYPAVVIFVAVGILTFIMMYIVPTFAKLFDDFELELPFVTTLLVETSNKIVVYFWLIPLVPVALFVFVQLLCKFKAGRLGFHIYLMQWPVLGPLIGRSVLARTTRTLGTLVASGVPILEGLTITRETSGNAVYERMFSKVTDAIREGETIAKPMKEYAAVGFHPVALLLWVSSVSLPLLLIPMISFSVPVMQGTLGAMLGLALVAAARYWFIHKKRFVDDLVINMVDVGEETGELDTMLYKVADYYDEEVKNLTEGLLKLIEPLLIVFLGGAVGFIVIALFLPLISLITGLS